MEAFDEHVFVGSVAVLMLGLVHMVAPQCPRSDGFGAVAALGLTNRATVGGLGVGQEETSQKLLVRPRVVAFSGHVWMGASGGGGWRW